MNEEKLRIHDKVMEAISDGRQCVLFIYGHGGTGKIFLWNTIIRALRAGEQVVLTIAAYIIASLLLPSWRTAHSRFKLPLDLSEESDCFVKKNTLLSRLIWKLHLSCGIRLP